MCEYPQVMAISTAICCCTYLLSVSFRSAGLQTPISKYTFLGVVPKYPIWNRIPGLINALGLAPERVYELLDFYHAVEHLGTVAGLRKTWSSKERKRWVSKQRGSLLKGKAADVVQAVQMLCRGRNSQVGWAKAQRCPPLYV